MIGAEKNLIILPNLLLVSLNVLLFDPFSCLVMFQALEGS